jgi:hypothetical protein
VNAPFTRSSNSRRWSRKTKTSRLSNRPRLSDGLAIGRVRRASGAWPECLIAGFNWTSAYGAERTSRGKGARDRATCGPRDHSFVVVDSIRWGWAGARATPLSGACGSSPGSTGGPGGTLPKLRGPIGTGRAKRLSEVVDCAGSCPNYLLGGPVLGIWTRLTGEHRRSRQAQSCVVDGIFDGIFGVKKSIYQKYRELLCYRGRCRGLPPHPFGDRPALIDQLLGAGGGASGPARASKAAIMSASVIRSGVWK